MRAVARCQRTQDAERRVAVSCELWRAKRTGVWTAEQPGSHADVSVPVDGMEPDESRDERRVEIVRAFEVFVHVPAKILRCNTS